MTVSVYVVLADEDEPMPFTVMGYVPSFDLWATLKVSVVEAPPAVMEVDANCALTPAGSPLTESATLWELPVPVFVALSVVEIECPRVTEP